MPHAAAEEKTLYAAGGRELELFVRSMTLEHQRITDGIGEIERAQDAVRAVANASALLALFALHARKENELLLPALLEQGADLDALLEAMHRTLA